MYKVNSRIWFGPVNSNFHFDDCFFLCWSGNIVIFFIILNEQFNFRLNLICLHLFCSVLSEDATQTQTFEVLAAGFHHYFTKQDHYKVGSALVSYHQLHTCVRN